MAGMRPSKPEREPDIFIHVPHPPPSLNEFADKRRNPYAYAAIRKRWEGYMKAAEITQKVKRPKEPFEYSLVLIQRFGTAYLDQINFSGGTKPITDIMQPTRSFTRGGKFFTVYGLGYISTDAHAKHEGIFEQIKCKRADLPTPMNKPGQKRMTPGMTTIKVWKMERKDFDPQQELFQ